MTWEVLCKCSGNVLIGYGSVIKLAMSELGHNLLGT